MSLKSIQNLKIENLTAATIKPVFKEAQNLVNKQARRWTGKEYKSPAFYALDKSGGLISSRGKRTLNQMKKELARAQRFLNDPSRTVAGWNKIKADNTKRLNQTLERRGSDKRLTVDDYDRFYTAYDKAKEIDPNIELYEYKYNVFDTLLTEITDTHKSAEELAVEITDQFAEIYRTKQESMDFEDISDMFQ